MGLTEAIFLGAAHLSVVEWVCFEHLHGEVVPVEAELGAVEAHCRHWVLGGCCRPQTSLHLSSVK